MWLRKYRLSILQSDDERGNEQIKEQLKEKRTARNNVVFLISKLLNFDKVQYPNLRRNL